MFNAKKGILIIYKCTWGKPPEHHIYIHNVQIPCSIDVIHLGHNLSEDIFKFKASKCVAHFNHQCKNSSLVNLLSAFTYMCFTNFKYAKSNIRNVLFHKYCTTFYGI